MENLFISDSPWIVWCLIPFLFFLARILDVSIGTIRIILISKGYRLVAPFLGFFESLIWILAIGQLMSHLDNFLYYIAYAAGFAAGTYTGMIIENKLSLGQVIVRIITNRDATDLLKHLRDEDYAATSIDAEGRNGDVKVLFLITHRINLKPVINMIKEFNPNAFYTVEDLRIVSGGVIPSKKATPFLRKRKCARKGMAQKK